MEPVAPAISVLLKLVSFQVKLGATLGCNEIECFAAFGAVVFLVFAFLYCGGAAFRTAYFSGWRFVILPIWRKLAILYGIIIKLSFCSEIVTTDPFFKPCDSHQSFGREIK
jgi:hypothetical protein